MTRGGHNATALALAVAGAIVCSWPAAAAWAIGCMLGAAAPDYLEIEYGMGRGRKALIRHRTLTHQPFLWMLAIFYIQTSHIDPLVKMLALGWACAALLHLAMDILTPVGIPLGWPWGDRTSLKIFRTGGTEWPVIFLVWLIATVAVALKLSEKHPEIAKIFSSIPLFRGIFNA